MSGVVSGSRLERLQVVWRRTRHEIQIATGAQQWARVAKLHDLEARLSAEIEAETPKPSPAVRGPIRGQRQKAEDRVTRHLERLGVTSHDVKVWAVGQGLLPAVRRGRVKGELVAAYEAAHQTQDGAA